MENTNTINTVTKDVTSKLIDSMGKKNDYDPILDDPISDGSQESGSDEGSSSGEEEGVDLDFPRENPAELLTFLHREMTNIQNLEDPQKRKYGLLRFYEVFVLAKKRATK
jgi:hypothetical protein